jgi:superfamily II DNA or RNA helicase
MNIQKAEHAFKLRPYQEQDRKAVSDAFLQRGISRALGVWPTAGGKTVMFSELHLEPEMQRWLNQFPTGRQKILVIAHRDELIEQAVKKLEASNPNLIIEVEKAGRKASPLADVIVASIQTLTGARGKRMKRLDPDRFRIVVVDEAHHAASPSYLTVLQYFGFLPPPHFMEESRPARDRGRDALLEWQRDKLSVWDGLHKPERLLLGVTATPKRGDNIGLEAVFQEIVFNRTIRELMELGFLSRLRAFRVLTSTSLDEVATRAGDFAQEALGSTVNNDVRNTKAVKAYLEYAAGKKGVTFCVNVAHAQSLAAAYNAAGVPAAAIHGMLSDEKRKELLDKFRSGELLMLTNCQILTEGTDIPDIECIVHARPTKSTLLYIQMTGRGLRTAPGKSCCIVIDIVDVTRKHSLISAPELLGLPVSFDAKGDDLLETKVKLEDAAQANPLANLEDIKSIDDVQLRVEEVDLLGQFHDDAIDNHAALAWRKTGEGYELAWRGDILNECMEIVKKDIGWEIRYKKDARAQKANWQDQANSPAEAIKKAEDYIKKEKNWVHQMMRQNRPWREQPASDHQKQHLQKMGYNLNFDNLSRGEADNLIKLYWSKKGA